MVSRVLATRIALFIATAIVAVLLSGSASAGQWNLLGPAGGGIDRVAVDPTNPNIAYAEGASINRTLDGGATWTPLPLNLMVRDLAIDRLSPDTLYTVGFGSVYKSVNRGTSWTSLPLPAGTFGASPVSVAARGNLVLVGLDAGGLLRSTDGGLSWATIASVVDPYNFTVVAQIAIAPAPSNAVYLLTRHQVPSGSVRVQRSIDGGETWGLTNFSAYFPAHIAVSADAVFVTSGAYVLRSTDGGFSSATLGPFPELKGIAVDAGGTRVVLASSGGVRVSTDGGSTWSALVSTAPRNLNDAALSDSDPTRLYASTTEDGVLHSSDGGATWAPTSGINALFVWDIAVDPVHSGSVYTASMDAGVQKSTDSGATWVGANTGLIMDCAAQIEIDPLDPSTLYTLSIGGVYKSTDAAAHWSLVWAGPAGGWVSLLATDPNHSGTLLAATSSGLYRTTDRGVTWSNAGPSVSAQAIAFASGSPVVYAGGGNNVWRSDDGGLTWAIRPTGFPPSYVDAADGHTYPFIIYALGVNPRNPDVVYVGTNGPGAFKSINGGQTWEAVNTGLLQKDVRGFAFDTGNTSIVYLSTDGYGGVWRSTDAGAHWAAFDNGLTAGSRIVFPLVADLSPPFTLYGGTFAGVIRYKFVPPVASVQPSNAVGVEGSPVSSFGSFTDPDGDPMTIAASVGALHDNGDGSWTWQTVPPDDVTARPVVVTATDSHGAKTTEAFTYTAVNAPPILSPLSLTSTAAGASLSFSFTDPGVLDTHTGTIAWGDGTSTAFGESPVTASHAYGLGTFAITVTVRDKDGGVATATATLTMPVTPAALCALTRDYIQTSPKYQRLTPAEKAAFDRLAAPCQLLSKIVPQLTPAQKAIAVSSYKRVVQALAQAGWLTQAQAVTLVAFADKL